MLKAIKIIAVIQVVLVCLGILRHDDALIFDPLFMLSILAALLVPVILILALITKLQKKTFDHTSLAIIFVNIAVVGGYFIVWPLFRV